MKRLNKILGIAILVTIALSLMACGKKTDKKDKNITEAEAIKYINELKESESFETELSEVDENVIVNTYKITDTNTSVIKAYVGDGASAEELVLLKGDAAGIKTIVQTYLKDKEDNYSSYMPEEVLKIKNAVFKQYGEYSIICICKDNENAKSILGK
ncbi:MAG: DUF4358 domain-containing protein [Clostridiales bacterium]|nr:DUF4358 domain-containing protein [Clostridiales bacterium]MDD6292509.1 DUF4358 domain-containing protein [Eubacteriales bacterium]